MKTLHEMAVKLQESIIKQQDDAHNSTTLNVNKYNNLKLKMSTKFAYPHVIVTIGISEAVYNIAECTKTDGGLGPDEKYVRKWLGSSTVAADLKEIYIELSGLIKAEEESREISQEGEADEVKRDAPRKKHAFKNLLEGTIPMMEEAPENENPDDQMISLQEEMQNKIHSPHTQEESREVETAETVKKDLKNFLKSMFRKK